MRIIINEDTIMAEKIYTPFHFKECCICGKKFIKIPGSIYKLVFAGRVVHCCSYTCYSKAKEIKESCNSNEYNRLRKELEKGEIGEKDNKK